MVMPIGWFAGIGADSCGVQGGGSLLRWPSYRLPGLLNRPLIPGAAWSCALQAWRAV
jgi:hypothetical protein